MKKIYKLLFLITIIFSNLIMMNVRGLDDNLEIYPIKESPKINNLLRFYQNNNKSVIRIVVNKNRLNLEKNIEEEKEEIIEHQEEINYSNDVSYLYEQTANFDSKYTDLANYALQFVGNPYVYGGTSLTEGADCSGFVMKLYEQYGVSLPRTAGAQSTVGYSVSLENAQPGDIVSYGYNGVVSHSAIYIGNEMIVHAATPSDGITTASVYMMPIITIRRIG